MSIQEDGVRGFQMRRRTTAEIARDMRRNLERFVAATIKVKRAENERISAIVRLLQLVKEFERIDSEP